MIPSKATNQQPAPEAASCRPVECGEQWLGRNQSNRRRLWERLNPRHRKTLRLLVRALVLRQEKARLPDPLPACLVAAPDELDRRARSIEQLLSAVASRTRLRD